MISQGHYSEYRGRVHSRKTRDRHKLTLWSTHCWASRSLCYGKHVQTKTQDFSGDLHTSVMDLSFIYSSPQSPLASICRCYRQANTISSIDYAISDMSSLPGDGGLPQVPANATFDLLGLPVELRSMIYASTPSNAQHTSPTKATSKVVCLQ